jgi:hypothetical protein
MTPSGVTSQVVACWVLRAVPSAAVWPAGGCSVELLVTLEEAYEEARLKWSQSRHRP